MKARIAAIALTVLGVTSFAASHAEESGTGGTNGAAGNGSSPGVVQKVENGIDHAAKATGRGVKRVGEAAAHGVKVAGHAVNKVAKKVTGTSAPETEGSGKEGASAGTEK